MRLKLKIMDKNTLKEIIVSNEEFITKNIKNIIKRERLYFPEKINKTVIFYGVRRSGKTFILYDIFKKYNKKAGNCLYIDFEDERLGDFNSNDFEKIKEAFFELKPELAGKEICFLLDEIQNIDGWEKFCRRATERGNIKLFVSGSSSKIMPLEINTELRGRSWSIEIFPLSFKEYLHIKKIDLKGRTLSLYGNKKYLVKKHFSDYLKWGGFPEIAYLESDFEKTKLLKVYMSAMFFRDIVERYKISNISLLELLIDKLFSSFSTKFSITQIYKQYKDKIPFSKDTLFKYYRYLLDSMLIFEIKLFSESSYKRHRNPSKIYVIDTGMCKRVTSSDSGRLLENIVFIELKRRYSEIFYFEQEKECDFIIKTDNLDNKFLALQVTLELNETNRERETNGLIKACKYLKLKEGLIITADEEKDIVVDNINIKIIPAWKWLIANL